jgi:hypothetical protein
MNPKATLYTVAMLAVFLSGCAAIPDDTEQRERRAAADLRAGGAEEAARAAERRADVARKSFMCDGWLECSFQVVGALVWSFIEPQSKPQPQKKPWT